MTANSPRPRRYRVVRVQEHGYVVIDRADVIVASGFGTHLEAAGWINAQSRPQSWHRAEIVKACRGLFECGGVLEDALDCAVLAAQHEFAARVVFTAPAQMRVDGFEYRWPVEGNGHGQA
jgi:hypothetical protein